MFQLSGYPCCHAYATIAHTRAEVESYVDPCFSKERYLETYSYVIHGVPGQSNYIKTSFPPLKAPKFKLRRGRPKKLRSKTVDEPRHNTSTRKGLKVKCSNCQQYGHNKRKCKNPPHPTTSAKKVQTKSSREILSQLSDAPLETQSQDLPISQAVGPTFSETHNVAACHASDPVNRRRIPALLQENTEVVRSGQENSEAAGSSTQRKHAVTGISTLLAKIRARREDQV